MRALTAVMVMLTAAMLTGMGGLGGTPEGTVPKTEESIKAQLIDRSGVSTELSRFSRDGKVSLEGRRGEGAVSVSFHDLKEISFGPVSGDQAPADLLLKSGNRSTAQGTKERCLLRRYRVRCLLDPCGQRQPDRFFQMRPQYYQLRF